MAQPINIGLIGYKFMGKAHSNAYRQVAHFFPDVALQPVLKVIGGRDAIAVAQAATQFGWEESETDWRRIVARTDIQLVDISTPGNSHAEMVIAAAEAGKHILCEKPLANNLADAKAMLATVKRAGVVAMVNFNYRRVPAVQLAKHLIDAGRIGRINQWRATYLQDWIVDPTFPLTWRLQKERAGTGALGDIGAHIIDLARMLVGDISSVTGMLHTFTKQRPLPNNPAVMGEVTVDDAALFLARFDNGAIGSFEGSRFATGRANYNSFEINGSNGSIYFNLERLNELQVMFADDPPEVRGFRTILVTAPPHPYATAWWPHGHIIGWEHTFTHAIYDLLNGIALGQAPAPTFEDGVRCQAVLDAVERSAVSGVWVEPDY